MPVAAVAFAYGQDVDPMWDTTLAAPYSPLRLLLLRAVSVVVVALPLALAAAPLLPGPPWVAVAWLLPGLACAAAHPGALHLDPGVAGRRSRSPAAGSQR